MHSTIVALGSRAFVSALAGIGAEPVRCDTVSDFVDELKKIGIRRDVRMVFVAETQASEAQDAIEAFQRRSDAALLALPLHPSSEHPALVRVRRMVEQATGAGLI